MSETKAEAGTLEGLRDAVMWAMGSHDPVHVDCDPAGLVCSDVDHLADAIMPAVRAYYAAALTSPEVVEAAGLELFGQDYFNRLGVATTTRAALSAAVEALGVNP